MEDIKLNEKESLELITTMIQQTKLNLSSGRGNAFLYYGYSAVVISVVVFIAVWLTQDPRWSALWFLMFVPAVVKAIKDRGNKPKVVTYMDKAINDTWTVTGTLFTLTVVTIIAVSPVTGVCNFMVMMPLSLLYAGIGTSITGVIMRVRTLIYAPLPAFVIAIYMLMSLTVGHNGTVVWHLWFGLSFLVMMVIPGHLLNCKDPKTCSKN